MIRSVRALTAVAIAAAVMALLAGEAGAQTITFASGPTWQAFDADPAGPGATLLGNAQNVCLNASAPSGCPPGALLYGWPGGGWFANLAAIPGANWIWGPGVTAATRPAELAQFYFAKTIDVPGTPTAAVLRVSADDFAEVRVNGVVVGATGSTTNGSLAGAAQSALRSFDIIAFLVPGANTITVRAQNGIGAFGGCANCMYSQHPAGVVFGGSITAADTTPPTLILPADVTVDATGPAGAVVTYSASATDDVTGNPTVSCAPVSGSTFPIGTTTVGCTATDGAGNSSAASFDVIVLGASDQIDGLIALVQSFGLKQGIEKSLDAKLQNILAALDAASACNKLDSFVNEVSAQSGKALTTAEANQLIVAAIQIKTVLGCP